MFKRLVSLVLIIAILTTVTSLTTFAVSEKEENSFLFYDEMYDLIQGKPEDNYDEVYYHYVDANNPDSEIDWGIIHYLCNAGSPAMVKYLVFDRVITNYYIDAMFGSGWAIYDVKLNQFMPLVYTDISKYDGLEEALNKAKVGNPLGDADFDGVLTISDATYIQRVLADLCEYNVNDDLSIYGTWGKNYENPLNYISDIDGDGNRTIMDATAIQVKLAKK